MVDHTAVYHQGPDPVLPGHASVTVYVVETRTYGLHCGGGDEPYLDGCDWYGGGFKGRKAGTRMDAAWRRHIEFVEAGGVIQHGQPGSNNGCQCWTCRQADLLAGKVDA